MKKLIINWLFKKQLEEANITFGFIMGIHGDLVARKIRSINKEKVDLDAEIAYVENRISQIKKAVSKTSMANSYMRKLFPNG